MAILDFNQSGAETWTAKAQDLNDRTDMVMKSVAACLQEIKSESVGEMVDQLVLTGAEMLQATAGMVTALSSLISTTKGIIARLLQAVAEGVAEVAANKSTMTGF